jgi:nitrate/TMAO reductase-like tetraheme cytochrome c subunit
MSNEAKPPLLLLLTSHWISMLGVALVTLAGFAWLFSLPLSVRGQANNPYIGLLVFIAIPAVFVLGLALIPVGLALARRKIRAHVDTLTDRKTALRRGAIFFAAMTAINVAIASQGTYRAVEHMGTVQFCGQTCHVMKPEFTAHLMTPPHQAVGCEECHISPGATGWLKAKMAGTNQLFAVVFNSYPRPIESALENNKLVSSAETCERCHARERVIGPRLRTIASFKDDQENTRTDTVLMMLVGGGTTGGIHGRHMGPGVQIRYAAQDSKRQTIPWFEYSTQSGVKKEYRASASTPDSIASLPVHEMQCVDCHNRAAHSFEDPGRAVDADLAAGRISPALPFVKKTALELLKTNYSSSEEAAQKIPAGLASFYRQKYPEVLAKQAASIESAGQALVAIYQRNVFPDLKVMWGTYPNNLGHTDFPGCFRCHDGDHSTAAKETPSQDCDTCHNALAMDEKAPAILKTLGFSK